MQMKTWEKELKKNIRDRKLNGATRGFLQEEILKITNKYKLKEKTVSNSYYRKLKPLLDREISYLEKEVDNELIVDNNLDYEDQDDIFDKEYKQEDSGLIEKQDQIISTNTFSNNKEFKVQDTIEMTVIHIPTYGFHLVDDYGNRAILHFSRIFVTNPSENYSFANKDSSMSMFNRGILSADNLTVKFILSVRVGDKLRVTIDEIESGFSPGTFRFKCGLRYDPDQMEKIVNRTENFVERKSDNEKIVLNLEHNSEIDNLKNYIEHILCSKFNDEQLYILNSLVEQQGSYVKTMRLIFESLEDFNKIDLVTQFLNHLSNKVSRRCL
jgi:hypothetical protein